MKLLRFSILTIYLTGVLNIPVLAHFCAMEESFSLQVCDMCTEPEESSCCSETEESPVKEKLESQYEECCSTEISDSNLDCQISGNQKILLTPELSVISILSESVGEGISSFGKFSPDTSPPPRGVPVYLFHNILLI
ncbi:MAG: hypothetical protein IT279_04480 [Ignavibacteriaceae bacterium]|nr:hypothetical protein [Ignavibacteriaceae bacterium]